MNLNWSRVLTVARREFLTTVRRRAFLITLIGTPAYFVLIMTLSSGAAINEGRNALKEFRSLGVVDSSGLFRDAEPAIRTTLSAQEIGASRRGAPSTPLALSTDILRYPTQEAAERALLSGEVSQILVIPADYLASGSIRRYAVSGNPFTGATGRAVSRWLAASLVRPYVDPQVAARVARPLEKERFYTQDKDGRFVIQDDRREMVNIFFPMAFAMLLGLCLTVGGQYLLQGVSEEKESRILESLLTSVRPDELMVGKLAGLGSVGLLVVVIWAGTGLAAASPMLSQLEVTVPPGLIAIAVGYFLLGYLFYGSLMIGIGGMTNNMREAQQFSVWFTFANFAPMIALWAILSRPDGPLATGLSLFPPTAASTMMLRLTAQNSDVPAWQIALSLALLGLAAWFTLMAASRVFRIGMLLYGKTPNLPEILRWARSG